MAIVDKVNLARIIANHMSAREQSGLFLEWASRDHVTASDVLKWATEEMVKEAIEKYNDMPKVS